MRDPWEVRDLPQPPVYNFPNLIRMIGPGAVLLASSIGGGEWLVGPAVAVRYGLQFMWLVPLAIFFQLILNLQAIRFTLYTGEPVYVGFLRLGPGRRFWLAFYVLVAFLQMGWPALASASAVALFASYSGTLPSDLDSTSIYWIATGVVLVTLLLLSFGGTIERTLERISYLMMSLVFLFLLAVNLLFVPASHWWLTLRSFFDVTALAGEADWVLLGALVASSGAGGLGNLALTSWYRDKGMGMASLVGAIPSAIGGAALTLSPKGKVFPVTAENLRRWAEWLRFVRADQLYLWAFFAFSGMYLNVNLATAVIPAGTDLSGMATGAYQAKYLAEHVLPGLWGLTLLNGFWILFSTHLADTDILARTVADLLWAGCPSCPCWRGSSEAKTEEICVLPGLMNTPMIVEPLKDAYGAPSPSSRQQRQTGRHDEKGTKHHHGCVAHDLTGLQSGQGQCGQRPEGLDHIGQLIPHYFDHDRLSRCISKGVGSLDQNGAADDPLGTPGRNEQV